MDTLARPAQRFEAHQLSIESGHCRGDAGRTRHSRERRRAMSGLRRRVQFTLGVLWLLDAALWTTNTESMATYCPDAAPDRRHQAGTSRVLADD